MTLKRIFYIVSLSIVINMQGFSQCEVIDLDANKGYNYELGKIKYPDNITYNDSLKNYLTSIDTISESNESFELRIILETDTFLLSLSKSWFFYERSNNRGTVVVAESKIAPYAQFDYESKIFDYNTRKIIKINDSIMTPERIIEVRDSLFMQPSQYDVLMNANQDCSSYAMECLFRLNGINPEPIFFRNTIPRSPEIIKKICTKFCIKDSVYSTKTKRKLKNITLPDKSILILTDKNDKFIHCAFYTNGRFYNKLGHAAYSSYIQINPIIDHYKNARSFTVYTLNPNYFHLR